MSGELLPCPFCGSDGAIYEDDATFYAACSSYDCFCTVGEATDRYGDPQHVFLSEVAATAAWNTRTPTKAPDHG